MLSKAKISGADKDNRPSTGAVFYVPFNPNEITIQEACTDLKMDEQDASIKENQKSKHYLTLSCTLFFNTYTSLSPKTYEDVRGYIRKLYPYTNVENDEQLDLKKISFSWGTICVVGLLKSLQVKYTMFSPSGIPVRAEASIVIKGGYYGEKSSTLQQTQKEEWTKDPISFSDRISSFQEATEWKRLARKAGVTKVRT